MSLLGYCPVYFATQFWIMGSRIKSSNSPVCWRDLSQNGHIRKISISAYIRSSLQFGQTSTRVLVSSFFLNSYCILVTLIIMSILLLYTKKLKNERVNCKSLNYIFVQSWHLFQRTDKMPFFVSLFKPVCAPDILPAGLIIYAKARYFPFAFWRAVGYGNIILRIFQEKNLNAGYPWYRKFVPDCR